MYKDKIISVVIPAHNEEKLISKPIDSCPDFVDKIIVINDLSTDRTQEIVEACAKRNSKVILVNHEVNRLRDYLIIRTNFVSKKKWPYSKAFVDRFGTYLFAEDEGLLVHDTKNESL